MSVAPLRRFDLLRSTFEDHFVFRQRISTSSVQQPELMKAHRSGSTPRSEFSVQLLRVLQAIALLLLPVFTASIQAAEHVKEIEASAGSVDKALEGKLKHNFVVVSANEIIGPDDRHFHPRDIKAYLEKTKPDKKGAYVFWMPNPAASDVVRSMIKPLEEYGATMVIGREMGKASDPPEQASQDSKIPKRVMLVGQPNPKALSATDAMPDLSGREKQLRPGPLPRRVRYQFRPDAEVTAAAEQVRVAFLDSASPDTSTLFGDTLMVQAGAWNHVSHLPVLTDVQRVNFRVELSQRIADTKGGLLKQPAQSAAVLAELRALIVADSGAQLRAFRTDEMHFWWTYIGFDIEEPVFVLETNGGRHRFIVGCSKNRVTLLDELNALPKQ
jgi:hypothetical protein